MNGNLRLGFGKVEITPSEPVLLAGYYYERKSTGIHDRLYARAMAVSDGRRRIALCVVDLVDLPDDTVAKTRELVQQHCGLAPEELMLSAIHTHTAPDLEQEQTYLKSLPAKLAESVRAALESLTPCELRVARGEETSLQFIRRYRMKDGSVETNPGMLNPNVVAPLGVVDPEVRVLLASDDDRAVGGLVHYALHCDTVGGTEISADWTHFLRRRVCEKLGRDLTLLVPIGPTGDINHWNVFADVSLRGFAETERIGSRLAEAALEAVTRAEAVRSSRICALRKTVDVKIRVPSEEELAAAKSILAQPAPEDVDFTMDRVVAQRRVKATEIGPNVKLEIAVLAFGNVALVGIPAELFAALGREIKSRSPFDHTLVVTLANGNIGYVGAKVNYAEGGYETTSSLVAPGTGEAMADAAVGLLRAAKSQG